MSGTCKACDAPLQEHEIVWYEDLGKHEDLCSKCLTVVRELEEEEELTTINEDDNLTQEDEHNV